MSTKRVFRAHQAFQIRERKLHACLFLYFLPLSFKNSYPFLTSLPSLTLLPFPHHPALSRGPYPPAIQHGGLGSYVSSPIRQTVYDAFCIENHCPTIAEVYQIIDNKILLAWFHNLPLHKFSGSYAGSPLNPLLVGLCHFSFATMSTCLCVVF